MTNNPLPYTNEFGLEQLTLRESTNYVLDKNQWLLVMLDGRAFSSLIKRKFKLPFDDRFMGMMNETAKYVCENVSGCKLGYVQSDEINLVITAFDKPNSEPFFGYRLSKLLSIIASLATSKFNQLMTLQLIEQAEPTTNLSELIANQKLIQFDCKAWNVNSFQNVVNWLFFRQWDNVRNSRLQAAQAYLPQKDLMHKTAKQAAEMLKDVIGIDWFDYPDNIKYGRLICLKNVIWKATNPITHEEVEVTRNKWFVENAFNFSLEYEKLIHLFKPTLDESVLQLDLTKRLSIT